MNRFSRRNTAFAMIAILLLAALLLGACASATPSSSQAYEREAPPAAPMEEPAGGEMDRGVVMDASLPATSAERLVIKNANLSLIVDDPSASMDRITTLAEEMGGFVVTANLYERQLESGVSVPQGSITIRVPAEKLNEALDRIRSESDRLPVTENIQSQDVTKEYTDLSSRLRNLENTEKQLQKIMDEASKTEDVLNVYSRLVEVREQIEVIKGQMQYYEQSAALSVISVDLTANAAVQPLTIAGWQPAGVAKDAVQALLNTMKFFVNAAIWIVIYLLPVLLVFFVIFILPLVLLIRFLRRRRPTAQPPAAAPPPPAA